MRRHIAVYNAADLLWRGPLRVDSVTLASPVLVLGSSIDSLMVVSSQRIFSGAMLYEVQVTSVLLVATEVGALGVAHNYVSARNRPTLSRSGD